MGGCFSCANIYQKPQENKMSSVKVVKKGLLIGINYTGSDNALNGCINDQQNLCHFLEKGKYFKRDELTFMDDNRKSNLYPSKANILYQMDQLVTFANKNNDKEVLLFLSYSGHGYYLPDKNGDEEDGRDEVLCPVDYNSRGFITDDVIKSRLIDKLHSKVKLVILMDCCHSGTIVDLKYNYEAGNVNNYRVLGDLKDDPCETIMISGCKDDQTSADAYIRNGVSFEYQGAMTAAFLKNYSDNTSYRTLIEKMRNWLKKGGYSQIPQLSSSVALNVDNKLILDEYND